MARHPRAGDWGLIPGSGRSRRRRKWQPTPSILAWEMPRTEEPDGPQSMGCIKVGLNPATTNTSISKDHTQVCVCVCVCVSPLALLESVSESSCISASVCPDSRTPARSSGPGLSQVLWLWLRSLQRPAFLPLRGFVRVSVCLSVCLSVAGLLSQEVRGLGVGAKGGLGSAKGAGLRRSGRPRLPGFR